MRTAKAKDDVDAKPRALRTGSLLSGTPRPGRSRFGDRRSGEIKPLFIRVLMMLAAGGIVAAIMALKVAIYLPRFIHD